VAQHTGTSEPFSVDKGAVGAAQVGDDPPAGLHNDLGMVARNLVIGQNDLIVPMPSDTRRFELEGKDFSCALLYELPHVHTLSPRPILAGLCACRATEQYTTSANRRQIRCPDIDEDVICRMQCRPAEMAAAMQLFHRLGVRILNTSGAGTASMSHIDLRR
jgi:hypothetical protein